MSRLVASRALRFCTSVVDTRLCYFHRKTLTRLFSQSTNRTVLKSPLSNGQPFIRHNSGGNFHRSHQQARKNKDVVLYATAGVLVALGASYAAVPLYRIYCQSTGKGGRAFVDEDASAKIENMKANKERLITIRFEADTESQMAWMFKPTQSEIKVYPGETALAFYTATNPLNQPINGVATYNIVPYEAALYFNKIQCFCFEEQRLNPKEQVDMPVFFYIDPEYAEDPRLENIDTVVLSYMFFEAKDGVSLPFLKQAQNMPPPPPPPSAALVGGSSLNKA